jgi:hypothetical protein
LALVGVVAATGTAFPHWEAAAHMLLPCLDWPLAFFDLCVQVGTPSSCLTSSRCVPCVLSNSLRKPLPLLPLPRWSPTLWQTRAPLAAALGEEYPRALPAALGWHCHWESGWAASPAPVASRWPTATITTGRVKQQEQQLDVAVASAVVAELTTGLSGWRPAGLSMVQRSAVRLVLPPPRGAPAPVGRSLLRWLADLAASYLIGGWV